MSPFWLPKVPRSAMPHLMSSSRTELSIVLKFLLNTYLLGPLGPPSSSVWATLEHPIAGELIPPQGCEVIRSCVRCRTCGVRSALHLSTSCTRWQGKHHLQLTSNSRLGCHSAANHDHVAILISSTQNRLAPRYITIGSSCNIEKSQSAQLFSFPASRLLSAT